jgi:hypothetical protein
MPSSLQRSIDDVVNRQQPGDLHVRTHAREPIHPAHERVSCLGFSPRSSPPGVAGLPATAMHARRGYRGDPSIHPSPDQRHAGGRVVCGQPHVWARSLQRHTPAR